MAVSLKIIFLLKYSQIYLLKLTCKLTNFFKYSIKDVSLK